MPPNDRSTLLADILTEDELKYLSRAIYRQRIDSPEDEPELASHLDPLISVARDKSRSTNATE